MEKDIVFKGVETDDKVGLQSTIGLELLLEATDFAVILIDNLDTAATKDLRAIGDGTGDPSIEQVTASSHLSSLYDSAVVTISCAYKQYKTSAFGDRSDD